MTLEQYTNDRVSQAVVERWLQLSAQICLDIANHIISEEGFREPKDNQDMFVILNEEGIIPEDFIADLTGIARFRNVLVHMYAELDQTKVYAALTEHLEDFDRFAKLIVKFLEREA
jgi:uncharacterized protein YutE (UPF0331/DUF86 family)